MNHEKFKKIITKLYAAISKLEEMFPERHFTPENLTAASTKYTTGRAHWSDNSLPVGSYPATANIKSF